MLWQPDASAIHLWGIIWGPVHPSLKAIELGANFLLKMKYLSHHSAQTCLGGVKRPNKGSPMLLWLCRMIMVTWQPAAKQIQRVSKGITQAGNLFFHHVTPRKAVNLLFDCKPSIRTRTHMPYLPDLVWYAGDWLTGWAVAMGTRMEVAQLESRMNIEDYRKLQSLFLVSVCLFFCFFICQFINGLIFQHL